MDSLSVETIVQDLSKNQCKVRPEDLPRVADFLDNTDASVNSDGKGGSTNFRAIFVSTFMLLFNIKRTSEMHARKNGEKVNKNGKIAAAEIFENCKSPTVRGAVALFCLPKTLNRELKLKIIVAFLTGDNNECKVLDVCRNTSLHDKYKNYTITWKTPSEIYESQSVNQWMRLSRAILQIADYTDNKALSQFAKNFDRFSYYKNLMFFLKKNITSVVIYEPLINVYLKQCVAPIEASKTKTKLLLQFKINPHDVVTRIMEQLPIHERAPIDTSMLMDAKQVTLRSSESSVKPVKALDESHIQYYKPNRIFYVFIGDPNYQALIGIDNISTPQGIKHVQKIMHCVYDVIEVLDLQSKQTQSLMHLTWPQRLELVDSHAKISLIEMTGEALLNYKNTTDKAQAITFSCLNDDNLSTTQTVIIKADKVTSSKRKFTEDTTAKLKKPKIEETEL